MTTFAAVLLTALIYSVVILLASGSALTKLIDAELSFAGVANFLACLLSGFTVLLVLCILIVKVFSAL